MPKKIVKRVMPDKNIWVIKILKKILKKESLSNQRIPILKGIFVGIFIAFIPIPLQMLVIAFVSLLIGGNVLIGMLLAWITNPITMPIIFFLEYKLGGFLLRGDTTFDLVKEYNNFEVSHIDIYFKEMLLGGVTIGLLLSIIGTISIHYTWKWYLNKKKREKKFLTRKNKKRK